MKPILFLPSWYPSRLDAFNGDFIQRHALALSLFRPVHVVYIVRDKQNVITDSIKIEENQNGNLTETIIYYACKSYKIDFFDRLFSMKRFGHIYRSFFSRQQIENIGAVHVHVPYKAGLVALWLKKRYNMEYYLTEHWTGYDRNSRDNFFSRPPSFRYITKKIFNSAKYAIPVSQDLADKLLSIVPGIRIKLIPNVVNEKLFYLEKHEPKIFKFIHYVSSWKGQKNTEGLINVFSDLNRTKQNWECIMYGPAQQEIKELAAKLGLKERIKFSGEISYDSVADIVRSASAFVSFSNYENQPCSILEALCCGIPAIATRVGGIPEIINSQNGILVEPNDEAGLLEAIKIMMDNRDRYDREAIASDAKNNFSYNVVGKQLSLLYES